MRRTLTFISSMVFAVMPVLLRAQDTIMFPLKIRAGLEVSGPVIYLAEKKNLNAEGYVSYDLTYRTAISLSGGFSNYKYSQYNYNYSSKGVFFRIGPDFNLRNPMVKSDKYWAGIGLKYGVSFFTTETPSFRVLNYWGTYWSSIPPLRANAHFLEVSPGIRTEIFKNISIGWSLSLRMLVYSSAGKDNRPIYLPGFGKGDTKVSTGIGYYLVWSIPFKSVRYISRPEEPEPEPATAPSSTPANAPRSPSQFR